MGLATLSLEARSRDISIRGPQRTMCGLQSRSRGKFFPVVVSLYFSRPIM